MPGGIIAGSGRAHSRPCAVTCDPLSRGTKDDRREQSRELLQHFGGDGVFPLRRQTQDLRQGQKDLLREPEGHSVSAHAEPHVPPPRRRSRHIFERQTRGPWSIEAVSPKIWPGRTVATGLSLENMPTSPSRRRYMRFGMSRNGMPLWFSEKIFLPLAKVFGLPAKRKNSIATEVLYELAGLLSPIICCSSGQGVARQGAPRAQAPSAGRGKYGP